ncbi:MAG: transposase [Planctomycetes bacterium]|nr:transposase [Planctomycetota bacterium]MCB9891808.1 transposase [Planctomycetota bacterium]
MAHKPRKDEPGAWFHVMNRAVGRRSFFESRQDIRWFLSRIAHATRRQELEIHAWSILTTHFHLLVRSPTGRMSTALRRIQGEYVRRFNRGRGRDGPLVRGRFRSERVGSDAYMYMLVRYIDNNAVQARIVGDPAHYPYGSARYYMADAHPPWMTSNWIRDMVKGIAARKDYRPADYPRTLHDDGLRIDQTSRLIEDRLILRHHHERPDALDDLICSAPWKVLESLRERTRRADGTNPGLPVATPRAVVEAVSRSCKDQPPEPLFVRGRRYPLDQIMRTGLARDLTSATIRELACVIGQPKTTVHRWMEVHRTAMESDRDYANRAQSLTENIVRETIPTGVVRWIRERATSIAICAHDQPVLCQ